MNSSQHLKHPVFSSTMLVWSICPLPKQAMVKFKSQCLTMPALVNAIYSKEGGTSILTRECLYFPVVSHCVALSGRKPGWPQVQKPTCLCMGLKAGATMPSKNTRRRGGGRGRRKEKKEGSEGGRQSIANMPGSQIQSRGRRWSCCMQAGTWAW